MLRIVSAAVRGTVSRATVLKSPVLPKQCFVTECLQNRSFSGLASLTQNWSNVTDCKQKTLVSQVIASNIRPLELPPTTVPRRTLTKFSLRKGKRKTVKAVIKRFYRLHWGIWIRTRAGRNNSVWRKKPSTRRRLKQHVFVNATQSTLLDIMVNKYWRRPRFYVDDPYNPYHTREEFPKTRKKPKPFP